MPAAPAPSTNPALCDTEQALGRAFQDAPGPMALVCATQRRFLRVNQAMCDMLGYSADELLTLGPDEITHPDDREREQDALTARPGRVELDVRYLHRDGQVLHAALHAAALQGAAGEPVLIYQIQDITDRKSAEAELTWLARYDDLTGLVNRGAFVSALEVACARLAGERRLAVLFMDLDRFKFVNDTYGHSVGDDLLVQVADRLRYAMGERVLIARLGGDEFTVLLEDEQATSASVFADQVVEQIRRPFTLAGVEQYVHASVGVACATAGATAADVLRNADLAMYAAKRQGGSRIAQFDDDLHAQSARRLEVENALHQALDRDELRVFYQPKIALDTEEVCGAEALVRWDRPGHGLVTPAEFIPLAEETGLVVRLGELVLEAACLQQAAWQAHYPDRSLIVAVNVSAKQIAQPQFVDRVQQIIQRTGADPSRICLEVTESAVTDDPEAALKTLTALKEMGLLLAVDDFGTGFSSLAQLKHFPVDYLKIDRSFVGGLDRDDRDLAIVQSVVTLAAALGLTAVAEGIETREQLDTLRGLGCPRGQGFLFARAMEPEKLAAVLAAA